MLTFLGFPFAHYLIHTIVKIS